ncbi:hypothetical protein EV193_1088 [Herbihabitans rhizosphaerae]|uniref:Uncharacterized protein n=1 Tax=Herbihabitans rhizosphaerae TaxID=1872711 RepID=A0A4Q7KIB5_9PSEU|nr:hypothetical protein [Herbihabitans rhizosphaerae]RZS34660.1 hypothetical protein EV193_1088 [Herbihabitans rhizosphaerae]
MIIRGVAIAALAVVSLTACTRGEGEVADLRKTMEDAAAKAPLPDGVRLDPASARFDKGCSGLAECGDGDPTDASYEADLTLSDSVPAKWCEAITVPLRAKGFRLVSPFGGGRPSTMDKLFRLPSDSVRWAEVDEKVCATGGVSTMFVVNADGGSPVPGGYLSVWIPAKPGGSASRPRYEITTPIDGDKSIKKLPVNGPPLTRSELAHLRRVLDQRVVLVANPPQDGVGASLYFGRGRARFELTGGTAVRLWVRCVPGDNALVRAYQERSTAGEKPREEQRTVPCTGDAAEVTMPPVGSPVEVFAGVYETLPAPGASPKLTSRPYTVEVAPV